MNYYINLPTNEFLVSLSSHYFLPHIQEPSRLNSKSKTLMEIFSNMSLPHIISENLLATLLVHLPKYLIAPNILLNLFTPRPNNYEGDWSRFHLKKLFLIIFQLTGIIYCLHQSWMLTIIIKLSLKSLILYSTLMLLCKKSLKIN